MRALVAFLLLCPLVLPSVAAASEVPTFDVTDATGDSRAYPDVRLAQTDIARFTSRLEGDVVVQTVHVVGPWPANDYWTEIRNGFGSGESLTLKVERMNSTGSNVRPIDYNSTFVQSNDPARAGKRVNFTYERTDTSITFRWPATAIPPTGTCFSPSVTTLSRTVVNGRSTQVDDELDISPYMCGTGARLDGVDGTCPAPASARVVAASAQDARGDVGERDNLAYKPHDNATLDVLSYDQRVEDGWVVQTLTLAEASPRDQVEITIDSQYRANKSEYQRGAYASVRLSGTSASGSLIGEGSSASFHVRAQRVEPAGWELRWCASLVPADAACFATVARATMQNGRYIDASPLAGAPCPEPEDGDGEGTTTPSTSPTSTPAPSSEETKGAPGLGSMAIAAAAALVALALRRRA